MHLLGICVLLVFLLFTNLASDFSRSDDYYYDYSYEQERTDAPVRVSTSARSWERPPGPHGGVIHPSGNKGTRNKNGPLCSGGG